MAVLEGCVVVGSEDVFPVEDEAGRDSWRVDLLTHPAVVDAKLSTRTVWAALLLRMHNDGWCVPRLRWVAHVSGIQLETARLALRDLEGRGLIKRTPRFQRSGRQTSSHLSLGPVARGRLPDSPAPSPLAAEMLEVARQQRELAAEEALVPRSERLGRGRV